MRIVVARSAGELEPLRGPWETLQRECPSTVFQRFDWNLLAARVFADREAPYVVFAEDAGGMALLPAAISAGPTITFLGEALFDYRQFLWRGDGRALAAAWGVLADLELSLAVTAVHDASAAEWQPLQLVPFTAAPYVLRHDAPAEEFASTHRWSKRLLPRLRKLGAEMKRHPGDAGELVERIYRDKARQFSDHAFNIFGDPRRRAFMAAALRLAPDRSDIFTLERNGELVASLVTLMDGRVRRFYTIGYHPAWATHSPGGALMFEVTRLSLAEDLDCDYMTGEQEHKRRLTNLKAPLYRVLATPTQVRGYAETVCGWEFAA